MCQNGYRFDTTFFVFPSLLIAHTRIVQNNVSRETRKHDPLGEFDYNETKSLRRQAWTMAKYNTLDEFMTSIDDPAHVQKLAALIQWALDRFPTLLLRIAWNQPMLTDHGTFIIGFSAATNHISIAVEDKTLDLYRDTITQAGYKSSKRLFQM
ncbi:hypothetical protein IV56_GL002389 [Lacticaseibacillus saniviri JCM 17471 = DSM 24301]|uniref:YdhG-like domain-containing protein n=2 Tax=Lacticaseibacillus saniviri TaxID=931533 RepID=A0A0R2MTE8_9LACO|nr:hypothetical protein IV56_GL002389 [Lacticaseibacillus saniviri JCM 17471 = DSM 24301]